ncbi:TIGR02452 family protein [Actinokineospora sp. HUAS TT18]|uniref:TIGR02452 family protein n=1 Tax=Actinokineospora sp. HUAS TT18 TaxID=3447451 RepID=UPI003F51E741
MNRQSLAAMAAETDQLVESGPYAEATATAIAGTRLYLPSTPLPTPPSGQSPSAPAISVTDESTLAAARRLGGHVACLNFASARKPGGGYRTGAQAQEESLARSSALAATLRAAPEFYAPNPNALYSHRVIYSPAVPVFRDDTGALIAPYNVAFLTVAAPNLGALTTDAERAQVPSILTTRATRVLAIAAAHGHRTLVLGAWGCGVFRNDPSVVATAFAEALAAVPAFDEVVFAILGTPELRATFARHLT